MNTLLHNKKGVALILVLALLAMLASFASLITAKARAALTQANNFRYAAQSWHLAQAGIHRACYELKFHAESGHAACAGNTINAQDTALESWYFEEGPAVDISDATGASFDILDGTDGDGITEVIDARRTIRLKIIDAASRVNVNSPDETGLTRLLTNLFAICDGSIDSNAATLIITGRANVEYNETASNGRIGWQGGYSTVAELRRFFASDAQFEAVSPYLTTRSFIDPKLIAPPGSGGYRSSQAPRENARAPININTADVRVLEAVLRGLPNISNAEANTVAQAIVTYRNTTPFTTWSQVETFLADEVTLSQTDERSIFDAVNPNRVKGTSYTTELCFDSGGIFSIEALAEIRNVLGMIAGQQACMMNTKIYDIMRISTFEDMVGSLDSLIASDADHDNDGITNIIDQTLSPVDSDFSDEFGDNRMPGFDNTTWFDSTPVYPDDDLGYSYESDYTRLYGAIKLGFWDNFDEADQESENMWMIYTGVWVSGQASSTNFVNVAGTHFPGNDSDQELWVPYPHANPQLEIPPYNSLIAGADFHLVLGERYDPFLDSTYTKNQYVRWPGDTFIRIQCNACPRTSLTESGVVNAIAPTDVPGRDYRDVEYVAFRENMWRSTYQSYLFGVSSLGNFYYPEAFYMYGATTGFDMDGNDFIDPAGLYHAIRNINAKYPPAALDQNTDVSDQPYLYNDVTLLGGYPNARNHFALPNWIYYAMQDPWQFDQVVQTFNTATLTALSGAARYKTYRLTINSNTSTCHVALPSNVSYFMSTQNLESESFLPSYAQENGSFGLLGKNSHPAWDDLRIISEEGEYTTAAFSPDTINSDNSNLLWGTLSWTETMTDDNAADPWLDMSVIYETGGSPDAAAFQLPASAQDGSGGRLADSTTPLQYPNDNIRLYIEMGVDNMPSNEAPDIPVFEDATITYLPETVIYDIRKT